jgi:hypothetical protein
MAIADSALNIGADAIGGAISHIGLVDGGGTEISGGGYARQAVTWTGATGGLIRPNADLVFDIGSGTTVAGWRGFSALTGGTNHGGSALTSETYGADGTYTLLAASTGVDLDAV